MKEQVEGGSGTERGLASAAPPGGSGTEIGFGS